MMDINVASLPLTLSTADAVELHWAVSYVEISDTTFGIASPPVTMYGQLSGPGNVAIVSATAGVTRQVKNINVRVVGGPAAVEFLLGEPE